MGESSYDIKGPGYVRARQEAESAKKNLVLVFDYTRHPVRAGYYLIGREVLKNELAVLIKELRKEEHKQDLSQTEITWFAPDELQFIMIRKEK